MQIDVKSSIVLKVLDVPISKIEFAHQVKHWLGRAISYILHAYASLHRLVFRVQAVSDPIIHMDAKQTSTKSLENGRVIPCNERLTSPEMLSPPKLQQQLTERDQEFDIEALVKALSRFPSPNQKRSGADSNCVTPSRFMDQSNPKGIVENILVKFKLAPNMRTALEKATVFDSKGLQSTHLDIDNLTGEYRAVWDITDHLSACCGFNHSIAYSGGFKEGLFHGLGSLYKQDNSDSYYLLEGKFDEGRFISGIIFTENEYIEGTYADGCNSGVGVIHYLDHPLTQNTPLSKHIYRGEFLNGQPHGKGKVFLFETQLEDKSTYHFPGTQCIASGEFHHGTITSGIFREEDGTTFSGAWSYENQHSIFQGNVLSKDSTWSYSGQCIDGAFQGNGVLHQHSIPYQCNEFDSNVMIKKTGTVKCKSTGEFFAGTFIKGIQEVEWSDGKKGSREVHDGSVTHAKITVQDGCQFVGVFNTFNLDGNGVVYSAAGDKLYSGDIQLGVAHGSGHIYSEGKVVEGIFNNGVLESRLSD